MVYSGFSTIYWMINVLGIVPVALHTQPWQKELFHYLFPRVIHENWGIQLWHPLFKESVPQAYSLFILVWRKKKECKRIRVEENNWVITKLNSVEKYKSYQIPSQAKTMNSSSSESWTWSEAKATLSFVQDFKKKNTDRKGPPKPTVFNSGSAVTICLSAGRSSFCFSSMSPRGK